MSQLRRSRIVAPLLLSAVLAGCDEPTRPVPASAPGARAGVAPSAGPAAQAIGLSTDSVLFTFVRTALAAAAPRPQAFTASGPGAVKPETGSRAVRVASMGATPASAGLTLSNPGNATLDWTSALDSAWFSLSPAQGQLGAGDTARLSVSAAPGERPLGRRAGRLQVVDPAAGGSPAAVYVEMNVVFAETGQLGSESFAAVGPPGSARYYEVHVPAGTRDLAIVTEAVSGDVDLYVRYGQAPTLRQFDCRPFTDGGDESCRLPAPEAGTYYVMLHGHGASSSALLAMGANAPAAPGRVRAAPLTTTSIGVTWTDESTNEGGFHVSRRSMPAGGAWSAWTTVGSAVPGATSFRQTWGLVTGTSYQYRVRAWSYSVNGWSYGGQSEWIPSAVMVLPAGPPAAPSGLSAVATSSSSTALAWADNSGDETAFTLGRAERNLDGTWGAYTTLTTNFPANATRHANVGLLAGREYRWRLRACNGGVCSAWTTSNILSLQPIPEALSGVAGAALSSTQVRVMWVHDGPNVGSFVVARAPVTGGVVGTWADVDTLPASRAEAIDAGLVPGRTYRYRVRACNASGCSPGLATGFITTPTVPAAPLGVAGTALSAGQVRVTWTDGAANESSFVVARASVSGGVVGTWATVATLPPNAVQFTDSTLASGHTYRFRVQACNAAGCSPFVATGYVTTP